MTDDYEIRTTLTEMDLDRVHHWLSTDAYWALGRTRDNVETAARNSLNVGVFRDGEQVAYTRVLTDHANFAWLCDVYARVGFTPLPRPQDWMIRLRGA